MNRYISIFFAPAFLLIVADSIKGQHIESPTEFLGYPLGTEFTYHHRVVDYFNYVGTQSKNVSIQKYGSTYERRELQVAFISSEENLRNLEEIRINNLRRTGLIEGRPIENDIAIVWFSYNVHGNEASSTETAMKILYDLAVNNNPKVTSWLKNLIIIIDPCLNPDGRDRYTNWYNQVSNAIPNVNINSREHHEGWAHGRTNHYLFDLNRDWVWQTQIESRQRLALYNKWMPQVHVDFHEQFPDSQYYFAPAANPIHEHITAWQKDFQAIVGRKNARYFDEKGWLYFTKESFDLLYPGYGDTYPTFNGAIGMTYEMPGHSIAGLSFKTQKGDTLTLSKRIEMHHTTSIATIETCYDNRESLLKEFSAYFSNVTKEKDIFILKSDRSDKISLLINLLIKNKIHYRSPAKPKTLKAFSFNKNEEVHIAVEPEDLIIPVNQPKSKLVKVLFERNTKLADTLTYDITAWSLPYAYGVDAYKTDEKIDMTDYNLSQNPVGQDKKTVYAYLLNWTSTIDAKFLAKVLELGYRVNYSTKNFLYHNTNYNAGTLIINRIDNSRKNYEEDLLKIADSLDRRLTPLYSGSSISAMDLGSQKIKYLSKPRVAMLAGEDISSYNFGELWYFFEQEIEYPIDIINKRWMSNVNINDYDVLLLPSGKYGEFESEDGFKKIDGWVKQGGNLILMENAIKSFIGESRFSLKKLNAEKDADKEEDPVLFPYETAIREGLKKSINGSIIRLEIDISHPMAYGYDTSYYTLKNNSDSYKFLCEGWNVGYISSSENTVAGFVGSKSKQALTKNLVFGVEQRGKGNVVYFVDNPVFRGFWQNGKLFMANAVFFNN